jgi:hypothetical protein
VILFSLAEKEEEFEKIYALFIAKVGGGCAILRARRSKIQKNSTEDFQCCVGVIVLGIYSFYR